MLIVTAAVIERDGRILAARRRPDQKHPLKWEFPGGKVEEGEEPPDGLRRELAEELGIEVDKAEEITRYPYQYQGRAPILLVFYRVRAFRGSICNLVFAELRWVARQELAALDWLEGDREFVRSLAAGDTLAEP